MRPAVAGEGDASPEAVNGDPSEKKIRRTPQTVQERENDIAYMKRCCDAELKSMAVTGLVASPFYFERVAILSHAAGDYRSEVRFCEKYLQLVEAHFSRPQLAMEPDVRLGPTYQAIVLRLPKAREAFKKAKAMRTRSRSKSKAPAEAK
jgi:hypothetical protein